MQNIQEIFDRVQKNKDESKKIRGMYKDSLSTNGEYEEIGEKIKTLRERKKQIELAVRQGMEKELMTLEDLKIDIASDMELLSDLALSELVKGETVAVKDAANNEYEPIFSVKFKKVS
ncbi:MAG TPA: hypothetical protein DCY48_05070 [Candidatus Magasanikbacteria bacterium]|nr:MAG: hypothetical protein A3I74_05060 [Candidatus Magasanikbacteria bacterium RIFCSPLOWO2_02_FULL_47_16]OGH79780.1 MAG: hypothetical protein A3C10_04210 [Candidatus Magasanikbacteria bacterium RIFCSPHIGHO2_02_FULL_48_18]OGH82567.1 MAG: hypothetical protein A3G08_03895 [Candidatus Magasanikbacteria bacterium RIFCSPLOWO2_12_FULL_47_9b]HAZ29111.1 hypothetical protein [Candidatus Magasanikbacteria bacterium]